jgi:hypothetical protein
MILYTFYIRCGSNVVVLVVLLLLGKYAWDQAVRLALTPEEAGMVLAKVPTLEPIELARRTRTDGQYGTDAEVGGILQKVFRAQGQPDGSVQFVIDYEMDGKGGQNPPSDKEAVSILRQVNVDLCVFFLE